MNFDEKKCNFSSNVRFLFWKLHINWLSAPSVSLCLSFADDIPNDFHICFFGATCWLFKCYSLTRWSHWSKDDVLIFSFFFCFQHFKIFFMVSIKFKSLSFSRKIYLFSFCLTIWSDIWQFLKWLDKNV